MAVVAGGAQPNWTARYHEHLLRSASRSKRTQDLYRKVMAQVAAGELVPSTLESRLNSFLQLQGREYADELAQVSMRFLTGVVQAGSAYSYELVDRIIPGIARPPLEPPPAFDPADWADWFQRFTDYASRESAALTHAVRSVMDRVAAGEATPIAVEEATEAMSRDRLPDSVAQMVGLYFDLLSGLDELNGQFSENYLGSVLGQDDRRGSVLDLRGMVGDTVRVRLAVANTEPAPTSVRCVVTAVRRADGIGRAFEPTLSVSPEGFDLAAGEEKSVELALVIQEGSYEPGHAYVAVLHVVTPEETLLEVPVRIRATAGAAP